MTFGRLRLRSRGYTLLEAVIAVSMVAMASITLMGVWIASMWSYDRTANQTMTDTDAVLAMGNMIQDVREAKSLARPASYRMVLTFPVKNGDGTYNRVVPDLANPVEYCQATANGTPSATGRHLWRKPTTGASRIIARD